MEWLYFIHVFSCLPVCLVCNVDVVKKLDGAGKAGSGRPPPAEGRGSRTTCGKETSCGGGSSGEPRMQPHKQR